MPSDDAGLPLNPKREAFVTEYLKDLNATQAAVRAGYSPATAEQQGYRLLRNAQVAARVAELQGARAERASIDAQTVLEGLLREARGEGPDTASTGRIRAWELVGKHIGMWQDKDPHADRAVNVNFNFKPLTPEQIEAERVKQAQDA